MNSESLSLETIIAEITPPSREVLEQARERTSQLVMPARALGRLHDIAEQLCAIQGTLGPSINRKAVLVMAGDHGVAASGVSAYPQEVTGAMVQTFLAGGAGINAISRHIDATVRVVDMGIIPELDPSQLPNGGKSLSVCKIAKGTSDFTLGPAMTRDQARDSVMAGFRYASELVTKGTQILGTGDMGIGNTTPSTAIGSVITGNSPSTMVGPGTGLDRERITSKCRIVEQGINVNQPNAEDGLDVLSKIGGFEIGGIVGIILSAAYHRCPVVIDGFISTAGALVAHTMCPQAIDFAFAGHCSEEPGHRYMLTYLGLKPILDLGMRLGEGTGAALAMTVVEAASRVMQDVMTFAEAGVPDKE
jgi:nicotinate-nucleotide--dimethylbenzimidazole phosphoribosyltransferase